MAEEKAERKDHGSLVDCNNTAIADNSITSTKPAESFMKRVTFLDNAAGNAAGWNPNGATTTFTISEPAVTSLDGSFVTVSVENALGAAIVCVVTDRSEFGHTFNLSCLTAPPNLAQLHYVVENLPAHAP